MSTQTVYQSLADKYFDAVAQTACEMLRIPSMSGSPCSTVWSPPAAPRQWRSCPLSCPCLVGVTRQTAIFAYQFGDGITNMAWFTYGTLLIFLSYGKVPIGRWYRFLWPLLLLLLGLSLVFLFIAIRIDY